MKSARGRLSETSPAAVDTDETENSVSSPLFGGWSSENFQTLFLRYFNNIFENISQKLKIDNY